MKASSTAAWSASRTRQRSLRLGAILTTVIVAVALTTGSALAAKGGNGANSTAPEYSTIALAPEIAARSAGGSQAMSRGSNVWFETDVVGLKGTEYPMVWLACVTADGTLVYGQLDYPDVVFTLGGGSSDWLTMEPPPATTCEAHLYAYGGKEKGRTVERELTDPAAGVLSFNTSG